MYAWGDNSRGQAGINRDATGIDPSVEGADLSNLYLTVAHPVTKGGSPSASARMDNIIRIAAGGDGSYAVRYNGTAFAWGDDREHPCWRRARSTRLP